jgi:hypothetical protein
VSDQPKKSVRARISSSKAEGAAWLAEHRNELPPEQPARSRDERRAHLSPAKLRASVEAERVRERSRKRRRIPAGMHPLRMLEVDGVLRIAKDGERPSQTWITSGPRLTSEFVEPDLARSMVAIGALGTRRTIRREIASATRHLVASLVDLWATILVEVLIEDLEEEQIRRLSPAQVSEADRVRLMFREQKRRAAYIATLSDEALAKLGPKWHEKPWRATPNDLLEAVRERVAEHAGLVAIPPTINAKEIAWARGSVSVGRGGGRGKKLSTDTLRDELVRRAHTQAVSPSE